MVPMTEVEALAQVLEGCDAAVYAYGLVAAHVTGAARAQALSAMAAHRASRDQLRTRLVAVGATPPPAAAAYTSPFPVTDASTARRLAALVEYRLAGQWAGLAAASTSTARSNAALAAQACAVRQVTWSGAAPVWSGSS
jgi:Domain of unknown function (DUF4439)